MVVLVFIYIGYHECKKGIVYLAFSLALWKKIDYRGSPFFLVARLPLETL